MGLGCEEAISINSDGDWSGRESKCISSESHKYGLNHGCAPCWLCDPGQVRGPQFSHLQSGDDNDNIISGLRRGLTEMCVQCFGWCFAHRGVYKSELLLGSSHPISFGSVLQCTGTQFLILRKYYYMIFGKRQKKKKKHLAGSPPLEITPT